MSDRYAKNQTPLFVRKQSGGAFTVVDVNKYAGNIWYVDSGASGATDAVGYGANPDKPFATIHYADTQCTASNGDVIVVAPGHTEDVSSAGAIDLNTIGVTIIGQGAGRLRPTITFSVDTGDINIDAANVTIENIHIDLTGVDSVNAALDVNAADFTLRGCEVLMADGTGQADSFIVTDANAHRMVIENNIIRSPNAGADDAIEIVGASDGMIIRGNFIYGDFNNAPIFNDTGSVATNVLIENNFLQNDQTGDHAIELKSAVTGIARNNILVTDAIATAADLGSLKAVDNWYFDSSDTDKSGYPYPVEPGTGAEGAITIGAASDTTTDSIHGKLGTDAEMNDSSLYDLVAVPLGLRNADARTGAASSTATAMSYLKQAITALGDMDDDSRIGAVSTTATVQSYAKQLVTSVGNMADDNRIGVVGTTASVQSYAKQLVTSVGNMADDNRIGVVGTTASVQSYAKQLVTSVGNMADDNRIGVVSTTASVQSYAKQLVTSVGNMADDNRIGVVGTTASVQSYAKQLVTSVGNMADDNRIGVVSTTASVQSYAKQLVTSVGNMADDNRIGAVSTTASIQSYAKQLVTSVGNMADNSRTGAVSTTASAQSYLKQLVASGDAMNINGANFLAVTADGTNVTWNAVGAHEIATVTGLVRLRIIPVISTSLTGAGAELVLGTEGDTNCMILATSAVELDDTEIWWSATAADNAVRLRTPTVRDSLMHDWIINGEDVGYTVRYAAFGTGSVVFNMFWEPLNATGAVAAGAGGVL
jgi:hypothetical protein